MSEKANNPKRGENDGRYPGGNSIFANFFKPVAKIFGWVAKGSEKQPVCRS